MEEIAKNNFIDAVKATQKSIVTGLILAVSLYIFALKSEITSIKAPLIGIEMDAVEGLWAILILYLMVGIALCFHSYRAKQNFNLIQSNQTRSALLLYPSVACGDPFIRYFSTLSPVLLFALAMSEAYDASLVKVFFMLSVFSSPYIFALWNLDYVAPRTVEDSAEPIA